MLHDYRDEISSRYPLIYSHTQLTYICQVLKMCKTLCSVPRLYYCEIWIVQSADVYGALSHARDRAD